MSCYSYFERLALSPSPLHFVYAFVRLNTAGNTASSNWGKKRFTYNPHLEPSFDDVCRRNKRGGRYSCDGAGG